MRSKLNKFEHVGGGGSSCVEFQYIMGNGHMGRPTEQND